MKKRQLLEVLKEMLVRKPKEVEKEKFGRKVIRDESGCGST